MVLRMKDMGSGPAGFLNDAFEDMQATMKKMFRSRHDYYRKFLRSTPIQDCLERNDVVVIALDNEDLGNRSGIP